MKSPEEQRADANAVWNAARDLLRAGGYDPWDHDDVERLFDDAARQVGVTNYGPLIFIGVAS